MLEGIPGHETGDSRLRGFRDAIKDAPGMTIVASQPANWERDQGFTVFQNMLQAHPDIDTRVRVQRPDGARRASRRSRPPARPARSASIGFDALDDAQEGDRGGDDGGVGGAVSVGDGHGSRWKAPSR